jgi:tyrosyl-tRNA synthetase
MIPAIEQLEILKRGCVEIINEADLLKKLEKSVEKNQPLVIKLGMDPTVPDLHLGHTVVLRKMRQFQDLGHKIIFLIGDFTAMVGDPSGKSETRKPLTEEQVKENALSYREQYGHILDMENTELRYNSEWLSKMTFADVIKLTSHYTVARILERDDFEKRYKSGRPIGIHEFLYPLMQGYDSVALKSDVELGATDQKFNLLVGRELQRDWQQAPQIIMMMPILVGLDGVQKMSKSLGNYVGISEVPEEMFGKIMSISDDMTFRYMELLTDIPMAEITKLKGEMAEGLLHPKSAKVRLAKEIIKIYHSSEAAEQAETHFERVFARKEIPEELDEVIISADKIKDGKIWLVECMREAGFIKSTSDGRRVIKDGGLKINGEKTDVEDFPVPESREFVLQSGKRKFCQIRIK